MVLMFWDKNKRKKTKKNLNYFLLTKFSKSYRNDMDPDRIHFFPVWIQDPDPHQN